MRKLAALFLILSFLATGGCSTKSQVLKAVKEDPELLMELLRENRFEILRLIQATLQEEQEIKIKEQLQEAIANPLVPALEQGRVIEGDLTAPITIVEYSDFLCPYCVHGHETMKKLLAKYAGTIRLVYKHNPLKKGSFGLAALYEAVAFKAPQKAAEFKDLLFRNQHAIHNAKDQGSVVDDLIKQLGLNEPEIQSMARSKEIKERIEADIKELSSFGMNGTPMYIIGGVPIRGAMPIENFETVIMLLEEHSAAQ